MKRLLLFFSFCVSYGLSAQKPFVCPDSTEDCGRYQTFIKAAHEAASGKPPRYDEAIVQYNAARVCCPSAAQTIDSLILVVFKMIERQRDAALEAEKRALKAEKKAKAEYEKAQKLISYFDFTPTRTRAWAYQNGKFAVIDKNGNRRTPFIYDDPDTFQITGYALARKGAHQLLVDSAGVPSEEFESLFPTNNNWYKAKKGKYYTFVDYNGKRLPGLEMYDYLENYSRNLALVSKDNRYGFADTKGNIAIPLRFSSALPFEGNLTWAEHPENGWGLINAKGDFVIEPKYSFAKSVSPGINFAGVTGKSGVIDTSGRANFAEYHEIVLSGLATGKNDRSGYQHESMGELVILLKYDVAEIFPKALPSSRVTPSNSLSTNRGKQIFA